MKKDKAIQLLFARSGQALQCGFIAGTVSQSPHSVLLFRGGNRIFRLLILVFLLLTARAMLMAQTPDCNNPIAGKGVVVDQYSGGLAALLTTNPDYENLLDGDLSNFAAVGLTTATGIGNVPIVSVKDHNTTYPAGRRVGFVVEIGASLSGLLSADILNGFQLRTYLDNTLQESAQLGGGGPAISLSLFGSETNKKRRLAFTTTLPFDEVELRLTGLVSSSLLTDIRVYYAYEESTTCNHDCMLAINTTNFASAAATTNGIGGFSSINNVTDADTTNAASRTFVLLGSAFVNVDANTNIPAGSEVGFVISQTGLLGLLSVDVLSNITVTTRNSSGTVLETFNGNTALANVGLLGNSGLTVLSFKINQNCEQLRINFNILLSILGTYNVHYAFVRYDSDGDTFADCVDKCDTGDDALDADGDGIPDACDSPFCDLDGGLDLNVCPSTGTATLPAAGVGQSWSAAAGNPSPAMINNAGMVSGLANEGVYLFVLTEGSCTDTVAINYLESLATLDCNDPIAVNGAIVDNNAGCVLCGNVDAGNVVDGDLSNFISYGDLLNLSLLGGQTPLIAVKDTLRTYPAGTRVGYVVSFPQGVLSLGLLDAFVLKTYMNDVLVETATTSGNLLGVDALGFNNGTQRIFFEATQAFDEIELVVAGGLVSLDLLSDINIFYAFTEDATTCPAGNGSGGADECSGEFLTNNDIFGQINYDRTGLDFVACALCTLDSLSHVVDDDLSNYTTLSLTVGAVGSAEISVRSPKVIPAGSEAGFGVSLAGSLLDVDLLTNLTITTYLNGVQQEQLAASSPLVSLSLLGGSSEVSLVGFTSTLSFNEIQLSVNGLASASLLGGVIRVYYAYYSQDSDGDGTADCLDKCCLGNDALDMDGDGMPDACDSGIMASDDMSTTNEDVAVVVNVLANDDFGANGPGVGPVEVGSIPANGIATVNTNGTPDNPADDTILYTPAANFTGQDTFTYIICDANFSCDTAEVIITISAINDGPMANNDVFPVNEDGMLSGSVVLNDVDADGPDTLITLVTDVLNGTLTLNGDGTFSYMPDGNYAGPDSFTYSYCDGGTPNICDTATVTITVNAINDGPMANDDTFPVDEGGMLSGSVAPNDVDADGPDTLITLVTDVLNGTLTLNGDGTFSYTPDPNYTGPDNFTYAYCDGGIPNICDTATVNITVNAVVLRLNIRVLLQGALLQDTSSMLMFDNLRQLGRIPLVEPYSALPAFTHFGGGGGETIADSSVVLADLAGNSIVDWVFVELRSVLDSSDVVATRSALLQRDGDVVDVDGLSPLVFTSFSPASYFVSVRHRNHLGVMTEQPIALSTSPALVDFTSFATAVYNRPFTSTLNNFNGLEQARINGRYALWAGNVIMDGRLIFAGQGNDVNNIFNEVVTAPGNVFGAQAFIRQGYLSGDVNLFGSTIYAGQNKDVDFVFNNVDSFLKNTFRSQVYVVREQLPDGNLP